jgi:hypothetical protein
MIVQWKSNGAMEYVAKWQGMALSLQYILQEARWGLLVNGQRVKQRWSSYRVGMEQIDATMTRMIQKQTAAGAHAQQRPTSRERIVHHGHAARS